MRYDFHTHTFLSDGELLPIELIRRAIALDHRAIALTDHVSASNLERVISETIKDCRLAEENWDIIALAGVELTHVPVGSLDKLVKLAKSLGAELILVHGETLAEPVEKGTNSAAVKNPDVDVLTHPGLLTQAHAELAKENRIFIELTSRKAHAATNPHIAKISKETGAKLLLNTDAHAPEDLIAEHQAEKICIELGLGSSEINKVLYENPKMLLKKLGR